MSDDEAAWRTGEDHQDAEIVRLAAYAGLRRGELVALRWRDVDLRRKLVVRRAVSANVEAASTKSRQVFVESEYEECYQELFTLLRDRFDSPLTLAFIAAGKGGGGGEAAVHHLVSSLRAAGNPTCFGIVDRDARQDADEGIFFVPTRYALENLVLDPLPLGLLILRDGVRAPHDMGLPPERRHFELRSEEAQLVVDFVVAETGMPRDGASRRVPYAGNWEADVPTSWLDANGHELEARVTGAFPGLKRHRDHLKLAVVRSALRDVPAATPTEVLDLFHAVLQA